ncbi:MAG: Txe/YoeB family addiction module toxin [Eggerthellaceae bacterium]|jgi:toxin YoeB|nr:Txe/YoeB family addiction module toxin [Eggerthellaceae bacterium]
MIFRYSKPAVKDLSSWKKSGQMKVLAKIQDIQNEIEKDPFAIEGKHNPEQLKHDYSGWYSREITRKDRFVYRPHPDESNVIEVIQCRGHYSDK